MRLEPLLAKFFWLIQGHIGKDWLVPWLVGTGRLAPGPLPLLLFDRGDLLDCGTCARCLSRDCGTCALCLCRDCGTCVPFMSRSSATFDRYKANVATGLLDDCPDLRLMVPMLT